MIISKRLYGIILISGIIAIISCFLPWRSWGDAIYYTFSGVQFQPYVSDNGGGLVILLVVIELILFRFLRNVSRRIAIVMNGPAYWGLINAVFAILTYYGMKSGASSEIGAPTLGIGAILLLISSIIMIITSTIATIKYLGLIY